MAAVTPLAELLGESPVIHAVRATVERLLAHSVEGRRLPPLLIQGETGTGKGLLARAIHRAGPRVAGPLVEVNCAAIPDTLIEAELFGFERGAFTDARQPKAGLFQTAHQGTLFLDEVGLLPEGVQAKLLKVLEDQSVRRLGSTRSEPADIALVAATSEDLRDAVQARRFREDLYHRLAVVTVQLPPLAERGPDILLLAEHFLARACADYGLAGRRLTPDARAALCAYAWPGNIRELANVMERVALLTDTSVVTAAVLGLPTLPGLETAEPGPGEKPRPFRDAMGTVERAQLLEALNDTQWNIARAAVRLQIPRGTLRYRIERLGLQRSGSPPAGAGPPGPRSSPEPTLPARAGPARGAAAWQRRQLAFLRASLTPPNGDTGPEITRALEVLAAKAESFGARVEGLGPATLVAAFGLEPIEDASRRAAHAAIAMRKAVERARLATSDAVGTKIAIHASAGLVGQAEEVPVIDVAATSQAYAVLEALVRVAEWDTILVSAAAARVLERRFALAPLGAIDPPGYRLEGLEHAGLAPRGPMTPLVARDPELELLRRALGRAATGHGQVVAIVGEPGVGKSRLAWEVTHAHQSQGWLSLHANAVSYGQAIPYLPVIELLKAYLHIEDRDDPRTIREKVTERLLALDPTLRPGLPPLLALLDVPVDDSAWQALDPPQRRQRTLEAIRRLVLREAQVQPLLLVVEDLQWIDSETQAFLDSLVESIPTARLCILVDYRPEYQHGWGNKTAYSQLRLDPLPPESAHTLLRTLLGEDPGLERLTALLVERTDGNPFFLEEIVQTLVETGALSGERGAHYLARPIDTVEVPATVQAVLAARIDRLPPEERHLLEAASVIGKDAPFALLQAITELPEDALRRGLATLQDAELLYEARLMPDLEYTFKHTLTRDVTYDGVPHDRRRALHARIVDAVERLFPGRLAEHAERLADHALRGEVWEKAVGYLRQAGAKALARSAYREAVARLEYALGALAHVPESRETLEQAIDARLDLRNALWALAEYPRIFDVLHEAETLTRALGDQRRLGWVSAHLSNYFARHGKHDRAVDSGRRGLAIARDTHDFGLQVVATYNLAVAHRVLGDYPEAISQFQSNMQALEGARLLERFGLPALPSVLSRAFLAACHAERGEFMEGLAIGDEGIRIAESIDHPFSVAFALSSAGYVRARRGDVDQAISMLERAVALCQAWEIGAVLIGPVSTLGHAYALAGRFAEALPLLQRASKPAGVLLTLYMTFRGEAQLLAGHVDEALAVARQALALSRDRKERGHEAWALRLLGEMASHRDCLDEAAAATHYGAAMALASELGMRPLVAHCHLGLGRLGSRTGDEGAARKQLTTAAAMYQEMDMDFWLAQAEAALGPLR
jgi:DNA-binding NtrC family response regulator/tetratricopeptide (TPR) repeat protein